MADVGEASGKPPKGKRDTYTYNGKEYSAREFYEKLKDIKRNSRASWWAFFNVVLVNNAVKLACAFCPTQLSATNPSAVAPQHLASYHKDAISSSSQQSTDPTAGVFKHPSQCIGFIMVMTLLAAEDEKSACV
ncbi:hypothetical protein VOLCADRAFT_96965 [Volvox carteri f. nagariensis]|uniref:DUF7963 domain-containing protein n=1 Tax=Volvox carteri f. nagariensis TaxID=3068 RepID=D8UBF9_VOLCA|nr:uncharacterized protein VOLCADRAFT_96965 [Volvox carteri f. nagariensis]EFJ42941.1 hypothetical protein VOLCADRAFT_96965 [Volvox carteri f. nagariensis]|eukprot:XP_002955981.1 hypothetical protein VOLCADRAFT_96965 [Volvox carteri f. nagariensis]